MSKRNYTIKRILSGMLATVLLISCLPASVLAIENKSSTPQFYNPDQGQWLYFGWENEWPKSISYMGGAMHPARTNNDDPNDRSYLPMIKYSVSINGTEYVPDETSRNRREEILWYQSDGYMNSPVSEWDAGDLEVRIQHIANRVLHDSATVVFTKVTLTNPTDQAVTADLNVSADASFEVPLNDLTASTTGNDYTVYTAEVAANGAVDLEFAALSNGTATAEQLKGLEGFDENYNEVKAHYDGLLKGLAQPVSLPDDEIINAYKNSMIVMWETMVKKEADISGEQDATIDQISNIEASPVEQAFDLSALEHQPPDLTVDPSGSLEGIKNNSSIVYPSVTFDGTVSTVTMGFALPSADLAKGGAAEVYVDAEETPRATIQFDALTGGWQNYQDASAKLSTPITAGKHKLRIVFVNEMAGESNLFNVKGMSFSGTKQLEMQTAVQSFDLYELYQQQQEAAYSDLEVKAGGTLENIHNNSSITYPKVTFNSSYQSVSMGFALPNAALAKGGAAEVYVDQEETPRATIHFKAITGDWQNYQDASAELSEPIDAGVHSIHIVFVNAGAGTANLFNVKGLSFTGEIPEVDAYTVLGALTVPAGSTTVTMNVEADTQYTAYDFQLVDVLGKSYGTARLEQGADAGAVEFALSGVSEDTTLYLCYKAETAVVYNYEIRGSGGNTAGFYQYDRFFSHDVPNMVEQFIRDGYLELAQRIMESPYYQALAYVPDQNYLDAIPKYIIPYATMWQVMSADERDAYFTDSVKEQIKAAAEMIASYMTGPNGLMAKSNTLDNGSDYLVVDNFAAIHGYAAYEYLAEAWGWSDEAAWAAERQETINTALNTKLKAFMSEQGISWYMNGLESSNSFWQRHIDGSVIYDGNWLGTTFMMSTFPWDATLRGFDLGGTWAEYLDASMDNAFALKDSRGDIPADSWGAWWGHEYGACYNVGMSLPLLYSEKYRTLSVEAYEWLMDNQSSPLMWGESFDQGMTETDWTKPAVDLETWGLGFMRQGLLEATASVKTNGDVIVGRGLPNDWLVPDAPIEWKNIQINDGRMLSKLKIETAADRQSVTLTLEGDAVSGDVIFNLPVFVNNIDSATAGMVNQGAGTVTCEGGTKTLTVRLRNAIPEKLGQVELTEVAQDENGDLSLSWNDVPGAAQYRVVLSDGQQETTITVDAPATTYTWTDALPMVTYTCKVTAVNGMEEGETSAARSITMTAPGEGETAVQAQMVLQDTDITTLDLTEAGQTDWIKTGVANAKDTVRKADGNRLSYHVLAKDADNFQMTDSKIAFSWSDGTPTVTGSDVVTANCVGANHNEELEGESRAWLLSVPVDAETQTLELYVSSWNATTRFDVLGSDSAKVLTSASYVSSDGQAVVKKITIDIGGAADSELSLQVLATITAKEGLWGNTALLAATLNGGSEEPEKVPVTGVGRGKTSAELKVGETVTLNATVTPDNATNKNVTWTSSDDTIATVDGGVVTAKKTGTATITVTTVDGAKTATCTITVKEKDDGGSTGGSSTTSSYTITVTQTTGGKINPSTTSVKKGSDKTFTITDDEGYKISDVLIDGKSVGAVSTYTFKNVTAKHTITAKFEKTGGVDHFTDVKDSDWFAEAVEYVVNNGLMTGVAADRFAPLSSTTRGMIVTILYREAGSPAVESDGKTWWSDARAWAMEEGISDGTNMDDVITREQLAAMLYRYVGSPAVSGTITGFSDANSVSTWASDAMLWAVQNGIISGSNGKLNPQGNATRAEVATMLMRFIENMV